jgi:hypothetical protein
MSCLAALNENPWSKHQEEGEGRMRKRITPMSGAIPPRTLAFAVRALPGRIAVYALS